MGGYEEVEREGSWRCIVTRKNRTQRGLENRKNLNLAIIYGSRGSLIRRTNAQEILSK